ncbi:MAG: nucleotidyltransferase domain-containing protein [Bacteroidales bacterium]
MDKINAINLSVQYLKRLKENKISFSDAWLFGSYAKNLQTADSDIDLAIILEDNAQKNFETEVQLMVIRNKEETLIEPHVFTKEEFQQKTPIVQQIIQNGERIKV